VLLGFLSSISQNPSTIISGWPFSDTGSAVGEDIISVKNETTSDESSTDVNAEKPVLHQDNMLSKVVKKQQKQGRVRFESGMRKMPHGLTLKK
jgi:hypothetical protein